MGKVNMIGNEVLINEEEITPEIKRVTLHPLTADGEIDLDVNLYPKCLVDGVVDREGKEVDIATQAELDAIAAEKQDNIPDLEDIRSKANTAVQPEDLATVATTGSYHDLVDKPIIPEIPVADVLVNGESVVNDETVAEIKLKTINGDAITGEGNIEVVTDLSDYYTKEETDEITDDLDERVDNLEEQVLIYDYFYAHSSEEILPDDSDSDSEDEVITHSLIIFPIRKTRYNLLEFSAKGRSDNSTDCSVELLEPEVLFSGDKILSNLTPITLYQTGLASDIASTKYGYDTFDITSKKVYRYCRPLTFRELLGHYEGETYIADGLTNKLDWNWSSASAGNGRIYINHNILENVGIHTENGIVLKSTKDIGIIYHGVGTTNFAIDNLKILDESISGKDDAFKKLTSDEYADVRIIFKRTEALVEDRSDITIEIPVISCSGEFETGISGFAGCVKSSFLSLKDLVYSKDQCDAKFETIADFDAKFNPNQYILKIGDTTVEPTSRDYNKLEATLQVYSTVLKEAGYPKYACANCAEPVDQTLGVAPYRGDTTFINAKNGNTYGYLVLSQGITYWVTKTKINDVDTDVVKQISLDPNSINVLNNWLDINIGISSTADITASTITTNNLRENENQTSIVSYDSDAYYTTVSQVGKIIATAGSNFTILQLEDSQNPGEFSNNGDTVRLMNVADPIDNLDAANKQYVDNREVPWSNVINKPDFAPIATSSSYNDLVDANIVNDAGKGSIKQISISKEGLTWSSDDELVATVDENGHIEAVGVGTATISVMDTLGKQAECIVTVSNPTRVLRGAKGALRSGGNVWQKVTGSLAAGQEYLIVSTNDSYCMLPKNASASESATTSAGNYASNAFDTTVDRFGFVFVDAGDGKFYIKDGTCFVRANGTTNNGLCSAANNNTNPAYGIWTITDTDSNGTYTIINNNNRQLSEYVASGVSTNWRSYAYDSSSRTNVHIYKKASAEPVQLAAPVIAIQDGIISWSTIEHAEGYDYTIYDHDSGSEVDSGSTSGTQIIISNLSLQPGSYDLDIIAIGDGTNYTDSDPSNTVEFSIEPEPEIISVSVSPQITTGVSYGDTVQFTATVEGTPEGGYDPSVNWSSSDPTKATIDNNGLATITNVPGQVTITATSVQDSTKYDSGVITVDPVLVSAIEIDPNTETDLTTGLSYPVSYTVTPAYASDLRVSWSTSDSNIAVVENDEILAVSAGFATITVTALDGSGISDSIGVTVSDPLGRLYLDVETLELKVGESYDLICSEYPISHVSGGMSASFGSGNDVENSNAITLGHGLSSTEDDQVVVGAYNDTNNVSYDARFVVGAGTNDADRFNAFAVTADGKAIAGAATEDSDDDETLVTKGYAEATFLAKTRIVSILTSDWVSSAKIIDLSPISVGADDVLFVSPTDDCGQEYYNCGIQRTVNGSTLTLTAAIVPENTITIQIIYFKGSSF